MVPTFNKSSSYKIQILYEKFPLGLQHHEMMGVTVYTLKPR